MKPLLFASGILALGAIGGAGYAFGPALLQSAEAARAPTPVAAAPAPLPAPASLPASTGAGAPLVTGSIAPAAPALPANGTPQRGVTYRSFNVDQPYIALTFDDGPSPTTTPQLLAVLRERGIKATFFVLGNMVAKHPEVLKMIADDGHEIGNHSWSHPQLTRIPMAAADKQIGDTSALIEEITGKKPLYLRPPYGSMKKSLHSHIEDTFALTVVNWSVDPLDWKKRDSQVVHDEIMKQVKPGAIVLSHDIYPSTVEAMPRIIDELIAKGYKFATLSQMIAMDKPLPVRAVAAVTPKPEHKTAQKKPAQKPHGTAPTSASAHPSSSASGRNGNLY